MVCSDAITNVFCATSNSLFLEVENGSESKKEKNDNKKEKKKNDKKDKKKEKKKEKKRKEKEEKDKGFISPSPLGTPVVPTIIRPPAGMNAYTNGNDTTDDDDYNHNGISHDHLTIQNTILNGNTSGGSSAEDSYDDDDDDDEEILSPSGTVRRKSVSFSNETSIGVAASEKKKDKEENKKKNKDKKGKKKGDKGK